MFEEILREIGLTSNEIKVYEALLHFGEATTNQLTVKSKVHRSNVYDALNKLIEKGLASMVFMKGEKKFQAIHPKRLLEIEKEREIKIENILPKMEKMFLSSEEKETALLYKGVSGIKNHLQDMLETKETIYIIGARGLWLDPRLKYIIHPFLNKSKRLGIKFKHIFHHEIKTQKKKIIKLIPNLEYRFFPKDYPIPMAITIYGPYVATYAGLKAGYFQEDQMMFIIKSRKLADGYRKLYKCLWDKCAEK